MGEVGSEVGWVARNGGPETRNAARNGINLVENEGGFSVQGEQGSVQSIERPKDPGYAGNVLPEGAGEVKRPDPILRIRPEGHGAWWDLRELWEFRDLWFALASRDLKLRYRQTFLGFLWVVFQPLAGAGVFAFVFGAVLQLRTSASGAQEAHAGGVTHPNYFLFSLVGTLLWTVFASTFSKSSMALLGNASLVAKVYFPRILLPLATLLSTLVDFGIGVSAFGVLALWNGVCPAWKGWLEFSAWAGIAAMIAMGLGLMASALMSRLRDIQHVLPLLLPFLMYASPVGYSLDRVPSEYQWLFEINPLTWILEGSRAALLGTGQVPGVWALGSVCASLCVLVLGFWMYRRMEKGVSDVL
jgi:lipopolysaccharide transport system permease protein